MRILVYCASGARSAVAVEVLGADRCTLGFPDEVPGGDALAGTAPHEIAQLFYSS